MAENKDWKADMFQETQEIDTLQATVKRSNTLQTETGRELNSMPERKELDAAVTDLRSQVCALIG